ncbi:RluA family pseudouridine synthase [Candidatus Peregrinibacteria bacterium]|nr:RluA family pseudouridine synthase [Candidatus Peregrinibacteria bacterium]
MRPKGATILGMKVLDLKVIFEDKNFCVIEKPAGVITETLAEDGAVFVKPVHRLDKDTSGILVMAKSESALAKLSAQWKARRVEKTYTVLVKGVFDVKAGRIEAPIARSFKDRKKMAVSNRPGSREASTDFCVKKSFGDVSLLSAFPLTGRTHQIRVHFASIGHPVVGDAVYGDAKLNVRFQKKFGLKRQFLHASKLMLDHPTTKKRITFRSPLPSDLAPVFKSLRSRSH